MTSEVDVSVVIVNYNTRHLLVEAVDALRASMGSLEHELIIVDNASRDGSQAFIQQTFPDARYIENTSNVGFGRANNEALPFCHGKFVLLLNTDAFVRADTLTKTVAFMEQRPDCGVLGVRLEGRDGKLQPSCRYFPTPFNSFLGRIGNYRSFKTVRRVDDMDWDHASLRECDWVPGCYYLCRRSVLDKVGLFDPRYFLYFEEVDHCRAVKAAGFKVFYFPDTTVVHIGGESAKSDASLTGSGRQISALQTESELLYFRKHGGMWAVATHLSLSTICDALLALKAVIKSRGRPVVTMHVAQIGQIWTLLRRTRLASRPTR